MKARKKKIQKKELKKKLKRQKQKKKKSSRSNAEIINGIKDKNKFSDELTNEIIEDILLNNIKTSKKSLVHNKKFNLINLIK